MAIQEIIERVGVCLFKGSKAGPGMFQRLRVKNSTQYRVWPVPGDMRPLPDMGPVEFMDRFEVVAEEKTKAVGRPN